MMNGESDISGDDLFGDTSIDRSVVDPSEPASSLVMMNANANAKSEESHNMKEEPIYPENMMTNNNNFNDYDLHPTTRGDVKETGDAIVETGEQSEPKPNQNDHSISNNGSSSDPAATVNRDGTAADMNYHASDPTSNNDSIPKNSGNDPILPATATEVSTIFVGNGKANGHAADRRSAIDPSMPAMAEEAAAAVARNKDDTDGTNSHVADPSTLVSNGSSNGDVPTENSPSQPRKQPQEEDVATDTDTDAQRINDENNTNTNTNSNDNDNGNDNIDPSFQQYAMELNVALESLETMRRLNLEVEFSTAASSSFPVHHDKCTYCQREALHRFLTKPPPPPPPGSGGEQGGGGINIGRVKLDGSRLRRFRSNVGSFFSKSAVGLENDGTSDVGDDGNGKKVAAQSCPPSLASPSISSMESVEVDSTTTASTTTTTNKSASASTAANTSSNSSSTKTVHHRANRRNLLKKHPPCLTCGHPTCSTHASSNFTKNHISICQPCAYLFELDFLVDIITSTSSDTAQCKRKVDNLVDCYDRAKLLLVFTSNYADDIAAALETTTTRSNKIGAGSSATGIVSGVAGVVGCGALLFPPVAAVGVPLLITSLVFGGGATAAQTGEAARAKYFSEPNKLAEKMVALHGMVLSLLRITEVLAYGLLKNQREGKSSQDVGGDDLTKREALAREIHELLEKHGVTTTQGVGALKTAAVGGMVATEVAAAGTSVAVAAGAEAGLSTSAIANGAGVVGRNSRYFGRVGTAAASGARFIPIAGGLLSAACVYVEGKELKRTLSKINEGNPCEKAEQVRNIRDEVAMLPDSSVIAAECHRVFELARNERTFF
eukprot:CAMPEP_0183706500 /NCGR_PEP_ID=MMETSP0737-20130205/3299_1 /TAXON_ID=385413 /ORGANISM="Thalassiosira miniscula, Strain CCMP1093" /LENGTH=834 /DNA_ID=CAMNT_0025933913 /DNA_START=64 /DNA_END=2568 /DNA_ORIENTATION=-